MSSGPSRFGEAPLVPRGRHVYVSRRSGSWWIAGRSDRIETDETPLSEADNDRNWRGSRPSISACRGRESSSGLSGEGDGSRIEGEKRAAGLAALAEIESGMTIGLGTGSTVRHFLEGLAVSLDAGLIRGVRGVPTSSDTELRCRVLGIPTLQLSDGLCLDVAVDGADEVSPDLDLVKGLGGALLREKIVVQAADRFVVIVDGAKEVGSLGERSLIPIEVAPFAWSSHLSFFRSLRAEPIPRQQDGEMVVTDNGNHLVDLAFAEGIESPEELDAVLHRRAGVVETGLFLKMADRVFTGSGDEVMRRDRRTP